MIDCGKDWLRRVWDVAPTAIVLTHAHPDHAWGLAGGAPCPVYATEATWALLDRLPVCDRRKMPRGKAVTIGGVKFKAVPIQHSIRAPAVGYRVSIGSRSFFYAPDIAGLPNRKRALGGIQVFIGDGAVLTRSMVRTKAGQLIGHAPVTTRTRLVRKCRRRAGDVYALWNGNRARQGAPTESARPPAREHARHQGRRMRWRPADPLPVKAW